MTSRTTATAKKQKQKSTAPPEDDMSTTLLTLPNFKIQRVQNTNGHERRVIVHTTEETRLGTAKIQQEMTLCESTPHVLARLMDLQQQQFLAELNKSEPDVRNLPMFYTGGTSSY
jgi:hypothetical protein